MVRMQKTSRGNIIESEGEIMMEDGKWNKNKSPVGWYVAKVLVRFEWDDEDKENPNRRCRAWVNQILIKAKNAELAYTKALEYGRLHEESEAWDDDDEERKGRWRFEGLVSLLAIYDKFEDGSEISYSESKNRSVKTIQSWVVPKDDLEVFDND
jgi:hypothetical protein